MFSDHLVDASNWETYLMNLQLANDRSILESIHNFSYSAGQPIYAYTD
jgi:hypothetical protein